MMKPDAGQAPHMRRLIALLAVPCLIGSLLASGPSARAAEPVEPGLAAAYTFGDFGDVAQVVEREASGKPNPGKPVLSLDQRGNEGKKVLTSSQFKFVGAILTGYIKFPQAGTYQFSMRTNDGTRVVIDGKTILQDAGPHPDRDTGPESVTVAEGGWHPIKVYFFQRLGSWALKLSWSGPGLTGMAPVAPEFLKH